MKRLYRAPLDRASSGQRGGRPPRQVSLGVTEACDGLRQVRLHPVTGCAIIPLRLLLL